MRTMPSVTLTTVPTLRASVADLNLSIRALMRSLISDALMDIPKSSSNTFRLSRQFERDALEPTEQGTIDNRIAGTQDRAADQCGICFAVQPHAALQLALQGLRQRLLLGGIDRRCRRHRHVDDAFRFVLVYVEQRGDLGQIPQPVIFRQSAEKILAMLIECGPGDTHDELRQILAADARISEQLMHARIAHRGGGGAQRL